MMKKMKNMKKSTVVSIAAVLVFAILLTSGTAVFNWSGAATQKKTTTTKVKKPGEVKGLKKVSEKCRWEGGKTPSEAKSKWELGRNVSSVKIKFNKVKGANGYQVLIYGTHRTPGYQTPLLFAKNTKNTTYTIKNLVPDYRYTIKVRAYKKDKKGKSIYGKAKSIKIKTGGRKKGLYYTCDSCFTSMSGNMNRITEHGNAVYKVHKEIHAGGAYYWR